MLPPSIAAFAARYPWTWFLLIVFVIKGPEWLSSVWNLFFNEPLAYRLAGSLNMRFPEWSPYWITAPLGLVMVVYVFYLWKSGKLVHASDPLKLSLFSVDRFIYDPDARTKLFVVLLIMLGLWVGYLQQRVRHLEVEMVRYVLPRQLTKEQIETFGKYLRDNSQPQEVGILYILGDSESAEYAHDFYSAFKAGKWHPTMKPVDPVTITCKESPQRSTQPVVCGTNLQQMINRLEGVHIEQTGPNPPHQEYIRDTVSEALKAADIQGIGGGGYGNNNDPVNTVTIFVGSRARHRLAVLPRNFFRPGPEDSLDNLKDDDF